MDEGVALPHRLVDFFREVSGIRSSLRKIRTQPSLLVGGC